MRMIMQVVLDDPGHGGRRQPQLVHPTVIDFPSHRPSSEGVTRRNFTGEVMDSKGRVLFVSDSVDCLLKENIS